MQCVFTAPLSHNVPPQTLRFFTFSQALAKELHVQFQLDDTWRPPALPPIAPENSGNPPPPPPRPPSPNFPIAESRIIRMVPIYSSSLSTYFLPTVKKRHLCSNPISNSIRNRQRVSIIVFRSLPRRLPMPTRDASSSWRHPRSA